MVSLRYYRHFGLSILIVIANSKLVEVCQGILSNTLSTLKSSFDPKRLRPNS